MTRIQSLTILKGVRLRIRSDKTLNTVSVKKPGFKVPGAVF